MLMLMSHRRRELRTCFEVIINNVKGPPSHGTGTAGTFSPTSVPMQLCTPPTRVHQLGIGIKKTCFRANAITKYLCSKAINPYHK